MLVRECEFVVWLVSLGCVGFCSGVGVVVFDIGVFLVIFVYDWEMFWRKFGRKVLIVKWFY